MYSHAISRITKFGEVIWATNLPEGIHGFPMIGINTLKWNVDGFFRLSIDAQTGFIVENEDGQ